MAMILIVDDQETNRELLTVLLGYGQHKTAEASSGVEGLDRARALRPDLIITDILMPTMDGYEFTRRVREDPAISATPVVFYSAHYLMQEARALAAKCGVEYIIPKPAEPDEVLRTISAALGGAPLVPLPQATPIQEFDREHIRVLTDRLSTQAGELQNLNARLEALIEVGRELNVAQSSLQLVERYCLAAREVVGAVCSAACIVEETGDVSKRFCSSGGELPAPNIPCPNCSLGAPSERPNPCQIDSYLIVPVMTRSRTYGWLGLGNKLGCAKFTGDDRRLLATLASQLAVGYENSRLFEELKRRNDDLEGEVAERRQSAEKYRMVVEQASDGIAIADAAGAYVEVNPKMLQMLGYTREEFLGLNITALIPSEDRVRNPIRFAQLESGNTIRGECRFLRQDRNLVEVEISMSRLEDGRIQAIVRDIAERKRLEAELRQSQKLEAVGRLAGGVAHDFNNLLTVILGHSDLAMASLDPKDHKRRDIENIREAGTRAAVLTGQLLAFSRKQVLQPKVLSLNAAVANLTKMLERLISSDIEIVAHLDPNPWHTKVDAVQLDQVILNLALNARDAMPLGGTLTIATANRRFDSGQASDAEVPPGSYAVLAVSDTGCGMDDETRSHLFEPFFTTKPPGKGTGLGLSTVYGIVRQSGGHIRVESETGQGTTVNVYLPRVHAARESIRPQAENDSMPGGTETVLLAEDEQRVRSLAALILTQLGYQVLEACDGEEAIEISREYRGEIHLLLSDMVMPKMNGRDLAERLRRDRPGIKVLLTSGYIGDMATQQGILEAAIPVLQKPFTPKTLAVKVREVLDGPRPSPTKRHGPQPTNTDDPTVHFPA